MDGLWGSFPHFDRDSLKGNHQVDGLYGVIPSSQFLSTSKFGKPPLVWIGGVDWI